MAEEKVRRSTPQVEGLLQVSKWLKCQVLLDPSEVRDLFDELGPLHIVQVSCPVVSGSEEVAVSYFCEQYAEYVKEFDGGRFRSLFSCAISTDLEDFYAMDLGSDRVLIKPIRPVIQLQAHSLFYSRVDQQFHPMVQGKESISWGVQFSYPQLYQDPKTKQVVKVSDREKFPNSALFSQLMAWMRKRSRPTPFLVDGVKKNAVVRIGEKALSWVNEHPQLKAQRIQVEA